MYDKHSIGKPIIELNERSWNYEYHTSQSVFPNGRYGVRELSLNPILTPFDYKGVKFNMITCPAGGKIDLNNWGLQEIKEPFMLGETEVTQELFEAVMGFNYSKFKKNNKKFKKNNKNPVETVNWFDCLEFCNRLSDYFGLDHCYILHDKKISMQYPLSIAKVNAAFIIGANGFRLPRGWEWRIAAMAGTNNEYAGTNDDESLERVAWFLENSGKTSHPVAQKLPNEWGLYDMGGNVGEWCENTTTPADNNNPSDYRVIHGADYISESFFLVSGFQNVLFSGNRDGLVGFRVARSMYSPEQLDT